jgi:hypothetical protein
MRLRFQLAFIFVLLPGAIACSSNLGTGSGDGDDTSTAGGGDGSSSTETGGRDGGTGGGPFATGGSDSAAGGQTSGVGGSDPLGDAKPSPGCGMGGRPEDGIVYENGSSPRGPSWLIFPEKYDGNEPLPVLFGFHGCGGGGDQNGTPYLSITRNNGFETDYIVAAPVSSVSNCYDYAVDMPKAKALYTELINNYCVDLSRVFATGHSYGAGGMVMALTDSSNADDFAHFDFRAIVPVAGWPVWDPQVVVPTMYIQGVTDAERDYGDGHEAVEKIVDVNQCGATSAAYPVDACNSNHDGDPVTAGCMTYDGCGAETIWCSHDDSDYGGTVHGLPCFYQQAMYDFFAGF